MWNYKHTSVISTGGRNLYTLHRGKISLVGRNDTLLAIRVSVYYYSGGYMVNKYNVTMLGYIVSLKNHLRLN